jgi:hypothetical protein
MKIDVEGGELDVLNGFRRTVQRDRPLIVCEVLPVYDPTSPIGAFRLERQGRLESLFEELDYDIARVGAHGLEPVDSFGIHGDLSLVNYVLSPRAGPTSTSPV